MRTMIPRIEAAGQSPRWQNELARAIRDPAELIDRLQLPLSLLPAAKRAHALFPLRVPESYLKQIEHGNPDDPLLLQILPHHDETINVPGYLPDPVDDQSAKLTPGLLKKYTGRALMITTGACAIHCRYCFRRHYPYSESGVSAWDAILQTLKDSPSLREIILSGGDPLSLNDQRLADLSQRLDQITHLRDLRIHTRLPTVLPSRVDDNLLDWLTASRLKPVMVVHINHPREISTDVAAALSRLKSANVTLFNQSVLLKGVNDNAQCLIELSEKLWQNGVHPYYLHLLDKVDGAAHFDLASDHASTLYHAIRSALPGYLVPQLVREEPGMPYKTPVF